MSSPSPPCWLNRSFFQRVIKHHTKDEASDVVDFTISSGSKSGENYASEMFRALINYTRTTSASAEKRRSSSISVIIKLKPQGENGGDIGAERMFSAEMKMYSETLIDINRLLRKATEDGDDVRLFPSLIYHSTEPAAIVLEDLSVTGFATLQSPDDYDTSKLIFHRLAMYHAASYYMQHQTNADFTDYNYSVYHMPDTIQESFFRHNLRIFRSLLVANQWPALGDTAKFVRRVDEMIEKCTERGRRAFTATAGGFNVLNHGDFFMRNMMFRRASGGSGGGRGKIADVRFLDFQLPVLASPAVDIYQALYGSMTTANRKEFRHKMILFYYETFVATLEKLGFCSQQQQPLPTLNDLNVELMRHGALGAQICICYLPYLLTEWSKVDADVMYVVNDDTESSKIKLYQSEAVAELMCAELDEFFYRGFI